MMYGPFSSLPPLVLQYSTVFMFQLSWHPGSDENLFNDR